MKPAKMVEYSDKNSIQSSPREDKSIEILSLRNKSQLSTRPGLRNPSQYASQKNSPKNKKKLGGEGAIYDPSEEAYDLGKLNKQILEDDEDAGGAIMKKLYRIHSRYVLEVNDNL